MSKKVTVAQKQPTKETKKQETKQVQLRKKNAVTTTTVRVPAKKLPLKAGVASKTPKLSGRPTIAMKMQTPGLPVSANVSNMKFPKTGKAFKKDVTQKRLQKKSPWFQAIQDPIHCAGVKIPDETGVTTGTLQMVMRYTAKANAAGMAGFRVLCPYVNSVPLGDPNGANVQTLTSTSTPNTVRWGSDADVAGNADAFPSVAEIKQTTENHRIVSMSLVVMPEASLATNEGEISLYAVPFQSINSPQYKDYQNLYSSSILPINQNKPGMIRWFPFAREDISFKSFFNTDATVMTDAIGASYDIPPWVAGFIGVGLEPGTAYQCTVCVNYEFKPIWNTLNILGATPSPVDATEVDLVEQWVQDMPITQPISIQKAASSPTAAEVRHEDDVTGFGMLGNIITELAPLALGVLSLI